MGLYFIWKLFTELSSCRGNGPSAITLTDMNSLFRIYEIDEMDEKIELIYLIKSLDVEWLSLTAEEMKHA